MVGVHVAHYSLGFYSGDLGVLFGVTSDGLELVVEALQDYTQDTRLYKIPTDVVELVPLLEHLRKVIIRVLVCHHGHAVAFAHQNTPPLHRGFEVLFGHCLLRPLLIGLLPRAEPTGKAVEEAVGRVIGGP